MSWHSMHHSAPLKIAIVGGGVASFVAGITLREALPDAAITLYTAVDETMIGGQLASWNEQGYPVEHGLHALFGFYDHVLPILKKIGAWKNLTQGAIKVAGLIAARSPAAQNDSGVGRMDKTPRGSPLVLPPPYHFPRSTASLFLLTANPERVTEAIPSELKLIPGLGSKVLLAVLRHEDVHAECDRSGARYYYNEVMLAAFVREKAVNPIGRMGLYPICLYVDDDTAMAVGREMYGFPKKMARIELGAETLSLVRGGLVPGAEPARVQPITLMSARWSDAPQAGPSYAGKLPSPLPSWGDLARLMSFYNTRHLTQPGTLHRASSDVSELTKVALSNVKMRLSSIHDLRLRVAASVNDPVYRLMPASCDAAQITADRGVTVELAFSMGTARIVNGPRLRANIAYPLTAPPATFPPGNKAITQSTQRCRAGVSEAGRALECK